ncbi:hypothetical protein CPB83DRAFT_228703 [Crepidotus variabilis]|uniref:Uncharacterized protein n=1 Tax=Crepidotus variabilis TaxID=179855 RepID=A0A9P6EU51_9AGAR|nr:hypothetical protein CPB83DRAFT_228703 [Crepidotus variabilis]
MAALPSFVELMATLGLSDRPSMPASHLDNSFAQHTQIMPESPRNDSLKSPARSSSSPALRDAAARHHSRFSPYSSISQISKRRGSVSSVISSTDAEPSPRSPTFTFPPRSTTSRTRRYRHRITSSDSSCDLAADMPISTYVRRKTPGTSPVTPNFDSGYESASPAHAQMPFSIPTLPVLLSTPANSSSAPASPISDSESDTKENQNYYRFVRQRRTGTRLSAPSRSFESDQLPRRNSVFN